MPRRRPRLYRYFNFEQERYGEPFALCDECYSNQPRPDGTTLVKIADGATGDCEGHAHQEKEVKP